MPCLMLILSHCELHTHIPTNVWYHLNNSEGQFKPKQLLNTIHGCIAYKNSIAIHFKCSILDLVLHTEWAHTWHARKQASIHIYIIYTILRQWREEKNPFPIPYWYTWLTGHDDTFTIYIHISVESKGYSISAHLINVSFTSFESAKNKIFFYSLKMSIINWSGIFMSIFTASWDG